MVVIGVAALTPVGFFGFIVILVWSLIVAIMIYRREGAEVEPPATGAPAPAGV